ncbi:unnamed protein product [Adineta steineri]|uniref:Uncharacterized protein n=1 Tax=Adineta steineri TaxID=433720 RepID=A0A814CSU3_9BILA|nr:unnamed protein product [Adineta steineri]CAF3796132.1 unnamed protein product [Adineta steineri]
MEVLITVVGEFLWTTSCGVVNFCLSSGISALVVFVSFLGAILASAFYKYSTSRGYMLSHHTTTALLDDDDDDDDDESVSTSLLTMKNSIKSPSSFQRTTNSIYNNPIDSLSNIHMPIDQNTSDNEEVIFNNMIEDDSDEEFQVQYIQNNYHSLNDTNMMTTDYLDQFNSYELQIDNETELESS